MGKINDIFTSLFVNPEPKDNISIFRNNNKNIVVFLHGLGGSPEKTWGDFPALLKMDPKMKNYDFHFIGFPARILGWVPGFSSLAGLLFSYLETKYNKYERVMLVGHSLGGIVIRCLIFDCVTKQSQEMLKKIDKIFLFGTPNNGAQAMRILKKFPFIYSNLLKSLGDKGFFEILNKGWNNIFTKDVPNDEMCKVVSFFGSNDKTIDTESSNVSFSHYSHKIDGDHFSMVKPQLVGAKELNDDECLDLSYSLLRKYLLEEEVNNGKKENIIKKTQFPDVARFLDSGDYDSAINALYEDSEKFKDIASCDIKLQISIMEQKCGKISDARRHVNYVKNSLWEDLPNDIKMQFEVLDIKILNQENEFDEVCNKITSLIGQLDLDDSFIHHKNSMYNRSGVAFAVKGENQKSEICFQKSLELLKITKQDHMKTTYDYFGTIANFFRGVNYSVYDHIERMKEIQSDFLENEVDNNYWQANPVKSYVHSLFAEAAFLLVKEKRKAWIRLAIANLLMTNIQCTHQAEGFAELLSLMPEGVESEKDNKKIIELAMKDKKGFQRKYLKGQDLLKCQQMLKHVEAPTQKNWIELRAFFDNYDRLY